MSKIKTPHQLLDMLNRLSPDTSIEDKQEIIDYIDELHNTIMTYQSQIDQINFCIEQLNKFITRQ